MKRKLKLKRETVRNLTNEGLRKAVGGYYVDDVTRNCPSQNKYNTCKPPCYSYEAIGCRNEDPDTGKADWPF